MLNKMTSRVARAVTLVFRTTVRSFVVCAAANDLSRTPHQEITARVFQPLGSDGHVLECGGVPPLLGKTQVSFRPRLPRRSKSGGAPPHSQTQAKLGAANDALRNCQKSAPILYVIPAPRITPAFSDSSG